ncbi:thylakoid lumenal 15.0 kDa protein 2, chloroplastic-like [Vigna radiata var. radiata]|uniref:Thylakoid lumenal 15.0 kDa protein 2, chloroplastic-like n=1 Tax=Vigna radiata var. radiata TaxID=3916 RepID=A0A3Q0EXB0_VIGRR|nr:thylakoid lumenal 15.0 kDa protein 2, chloroplastic-like [Vigna radiata var. radiata]
MFCGCRVRWKLFAFSGALSPGLLFRVVEDVKVGVNKPKLLSKEFSTIINVVGFLSDRQHGFLKRPLCIYMRSSNCPEHHKLYIYSIYN